MTAIVQTVKLGFQWATIDPFLFCVHHLDDYPEGNGANGPAASLVGRNIGQDFEGIDGWRMYHGESVPGFPSHPHRGFETVTYVRQGLIDHSDSLGAAARFGHGDTQWLTAGRGIQHSEMFPLLSTTERNPVELFQIWVNLPRVRKMAEPSFSMRWAADMNVLDIDGVTVSVVAGSYGEVVSQAAPKDSWAADPANDFAIWEIRAPATNAITLPTASADVGRMVYIFDGSVVVDGQHIESGTGIHMRADVSVSITAGPDGFSALVLQARPVGEPVAQYGPFVMNDRAGIEAAFRDYQRDGFGGWPWDRPDPVHEGEQRFARYPDGTRQVPTAAMTATS